MNDRAIVALPISACVCATVCAAVCVCSDLCRGEELWGYWLPNSIKRETYLSEVPRKFNLLSVLP